MNRRGFFIILMVVFLTGGLLSVRSIHRMQDYAEIVNYAGVVRGATQKLIKQELRGNPDDALVASLDALLLELQTGEGQVGIRRLESAAFQARLTEMQGHWSALKAEIAQVRAGADGQRLYDMSEDYFQLADNTVSQAEIYITQRARGLQWSLVTVMLLLLAVIVVLERYNAAQVARQAVMEEEREALRREQEEFDQAAETLRAPINDISELIYVSDFENYEILFLNEPGKNSFQIGEDYLGKKCYQILQNRDSPCAFCTNHLLKPGETYTWEHTNEVTGRHYLLKDRMVEWSGRPARMELAFDITEAESTKQMLRQALDVEKMLIDCLRTLYQDTDFPGAVGRMLEQLGHFLAARRTYLVLREQGVLRVEYEWTAEGETARLGLVQEDGPDSPVDLWTSMLEQGKCVLIGETEQERKAAPMVYERLRAFDVNRLAVGPLELDGSMMGFLVAENPAPERMQHVAAMFQALCYFIMLALERWKKEQRLARLSYQDTLTEFFNRNRYIQDVERLSAANRPVGVVYLDINGLKDINDCQGHAIGDQVLIQCAKEIRAAFDGAVFYRIGGDEFVILAAETHREAFEAQVEALRTRFRGNELFRAAIGARWVENSGGLKQVIAEADAEMYEDKKAYYRKHSVSNRYRHDNDELLAP